MTGNTVKAFGIGCIYFGYKDENAEEIEDRDLFLLDLKRRLEGVESVSEISFSNVTEKPYGDLVGLKDSLGDEVLVPIVHGGFQIAFDIFLPFRIQDAIYERCDVETFHVDMVYGYELPVTLISYDWPEEEGDAQPSSAVVIARKYLEKKLTDDKFVCAALGPSPFHANFALIEAKLDEGVRLVDNSISRAGYAAIELIAPPATPLLDAFLDAELENVFSIFYRLAYLRSQAISSHSAILDSAYGLLESGKPSNITAKIKIMWERGKTINSLNREIFTERLLRLDMARLIADNERSEIIGSGAVLDRHFDEHRSICSETSWSSFSEIAKFFEERRQKALGNFTAIIAGIVGGGIGSVATYLLTRSG